MRAVGLPDGGIGSFVSDAIGKLPQRPMSILDLGCGRGRHAKWLASRGHHVAAVDIDAVRLPTISEAAFGTVATIVADGTRTLPFRAASFDLVLVVHFVPARLVELVSPVLRSGGFLVVETFGGHGGNWRALPGKGEYRRALEGAFDVLEYLERMVGPTKTEAEAVKLLARKR